MANNYPNTAYPGDYDDAQPRVNGVDVIWDTEFEYHDECIRTIQLFTGIPGKLIGEDLVGSNPAGIHSRQASGSNALTFRAENVFSSGNLASFEHTNGGVVASVINYAGVYVGGLDAVSATLRVPVHATLPAPSTAGRLGFQTGGTPGLYSDDGVAWQGPLGAGGGGGNDSLPDIDQWVVVDKTTGSYTEDGTIQFPEDTVADAITAAAAMTPTATKRVAIKLMPGHYTEDSLDLPSYVYVVGESREACVITQTGDTEIIEQTNDHAGYYNVSIERLGDSGSSTGNTGTMTITVETPSWDTDTLDDAGGSFTSDLVGRLITISGSSDPGNNGTFPITAVNSSTQIVYGNTTWPRSNVTETLTYSYPTFTSAIDIDEVEDFHFRDVAFDFDERPGVLIRGTSDSDVVLERCFMTQTIVTGPSNGKLVHSGFTVSGSGNHQVLFDDVSAEGLCVSCGAGTLKVVDTRLHQLKMGGSANLFAYNCEIEAPDLPGDPAGSAFMPIDTYENALVLDTTGQVRVERSTILGWAAEVFGMYGPEWRYCVPVACNSQPSRLVFLNCHFGNHIPGRTPPTSPYQDLQNTIEGTVEGIFRHCTYDYPAAYTVVDVGSDVILVGPNEMYTSIRSALRAAGSRAQDGIVIKLTADYDDEGFSTYWPDDYLTILDLNGFLIEQNLVSINGSTENPQAVVKNGRTSSSDLIVVSTTSNTQDWKVHFQNLEVDPDEAISCYIRSGGSGAEAIFDNVRGWNGQGIYALWIDDVNPTVTLRNGSYIKGSSGNPAVRFTAANTKFRAARSTFIHGDSGSNNPFVSTVSGVIATLDFCRANSDPSSSSNISLTAESAYNIFNNALQDFAG